MAVSPIKINTNRLKTDADQIENVICSMEKKKEKLQAELEHLNSMWEGPAKESFTKAFRSDLKILDSVLKNLRTIQRYEVQSKEKYDNCENRVHELVSGIKV
ncbi:MAG: WXG100 family type VII secretion target [Lachnospiraceae bacterium]|nr:WXG100 family type VII secretion target [Lachnospiraceae bacterium]